MQTHHHERETLGAADRQVLIHGVASLRQAVSSMAGEMREVLRENAQLRSEIGQLRQGHRTSEQWMSEAERIKREVSHLANLHDVAVRPTRTNPPLTAGREENPPWSKKMMMLMMLADMA